MSAELSIARLDRIAEQVLATADAERWSEDDLTRQLATMARQAAARIVDLEAKPSPAASPAWRAYEIMVDNLAVAKQEIADLKAQLAQAGEWQPLDHDVIQRGLRLMLTANGLDEFNDCVVCRRVAQAQEEES